MTPRAAGIIVRDGQVLLVHRIKRGREYWVLPGGSVEAGESVEQACHREVKEETGLEIRIVDHLQTFFNEEREETWFSAVPIGGKLELGEPERSRQSPSNQYMLKWVGRDVFQKINFQPKQHSQAIAEHLAAGDA